MFFCRNYTMYVINLDFLLTICTLWSLQKGYVAADFTCVVGPTVVDTHSSKPITLQGFVNGFVDDTVGYSITFSSRDDSSIVTNGNIARFGKIGTLKGEKGDKGDMGSVVGCNTQGNQGPKGEEGMVTTPGNPGEVGDPGSRGFTGSNGGPGSQGADGTDEFYCVGETPSCGSSLHGFQCVQGPKGPKGVAGAACTPGLPGEKGEPSYPSLLGEQGQKGNKGMRGPQGPPGPDGINGDDGIDAPQAICSSTSTTTGLPGIELRLGYPGDPGDPGITATGPKGLKGLPGEPATLPGTKGDAGPVGSPGPAGPVGPQGGSVILNGDDGLLIRPLFQGSQGPSCVSNVLIAVETLSLYQPKEQYMKDMRFGVYYCDYFSPGSTFHVPALLYNQDELIPADAKRTIIVSVGDELNLCVDKKLPKKYVGQLEWVLNGNKTEKLSKWSGSSCINIKCVETSDEGIYEAFRRPIGRNAKQHAYFIVIVRACPDGKYNAPACNLDCGSCSNGYCNARTGSCICFHGFRGSDCVPTGEGILGRATGGIPCLDLGYGRSCEGALVCGENVGCTCASGWKGMHCDEPCESGTYGPDCCLECPASSSVCNRFTGLPCASLV